MRLDRLVVILLGVLAGWTIPPAAAEQKSGAPSPQQQRTAANVDGFRSAHFGMGEAELRKAIAADFGLKDDKVRRDVHPVEKTTVLSIGVDNLLPESGPAVISYIMGFTSLKLTQVNILWPQGNGAALGSTAMLLRNHFLGQEFRPDSVAANAQLPDGSLLVFRGVDQKGRMVTVLFRPSAPADGKDKADKPKDDATLRLSYIETPEKPDIFSVKPGQF